MTRKPNVARLGTANLLREGLTVRVRLPPSAGSLPINFRVEVVIHNQGTAPAVHCAAEIHAKGRMYRSIYPADLTVPAKTQQLVPFGFESIDLRSARDGQFVLACENFYTDFISLRNE